MHLLSKFISSLDGRATPWDNSCYAFLGDVTQGIATTIIFPNMAFAPLAPIMIYSEGYLQANAQALNNVDVFPPSPNQRNVNTSQVVNHYVMYLPS
jgi:hypothetical protein